MPKATDPEDDSITYTLTGTLPAGLTFDATADPPTLAGTPTAAQAQTQYTYTATATGGTDTIDFYITVVSVKPSSTGAERHLLNYITLPWSPIILNEIGNSADPDGKNDWIELRNVTDEPVNLKNYEISLVTRDSFKEKENENRDVKQVEIPDSDAYTLPAHGILLIVNTDPSETHLAGGKKFGVTDEPLQPKKGASHLYLVAPELNLPKPPYLLLLRKATNKNGTPEAIVDIAGNLFQYGNSNGKWTEVWPFSLALAPPFEHRETLRTRLEDGTVWQRDKAERLGIHPEAWVEVGYSGIGYDRRVTAETRFNGGTPGYAVDAIISTAPTGQISFSELMLATRGGLHSLPQWLELYNSSSTAAVNLKGWELAVEVRDTDGTHRAGTFVFDALSIFPNQTVLLVTWNGRNSGHFPEGRVYNLFQHHSEVLQKNHRFRNRVLSEFGFALQLADPYGTLVDVAGNLDGDRRSEDVPMWAVPSGYIADGVRSSLRRGYEEGTPLPGTESTSWIRAADASLTVHTYWGRETDIGTPGYRRGGPLPVALSSFHAARDVTTGAVVLEWTLESALNNAGFNLLRSETSTGAFHRINATLIAGAGTTGERHRYSYTDITPKPNAVYYYRLAAVSFSGERQQFAMVRLKGHVSASGKSMTQWGTVKTREYR